MRVIRIAILALLLSALNSCANVPTAPTVEQLNAIEANRSADCMAKGYQQGTKDYETCMALGSVNRATCVGTYTASVPIFGSLIGASQCKQ